MKKYLRSQLLFSSPWLLAAAAGLLVIIIVTFAFHNYRLEKRLMSMAMLQKADTLIQAVRSGARFTYLADLKKNFLDSESWQEHVQRFIDHLVDDRQIKNIILIDQQGGIIAHNKKNKVGEILQGSEDIAASFPVVSDSMLHTAILTDAEGQRVMRTIRPYMPLVKRKPNFFMHHMRHGRRQGLLFSQILMAEEFFRDLGGHVPTAPDKEADQYYILVDLDMAQFDKTLGRLQVQIVMLSAAMLLVGVAGWFSLSVVQGYRVSQKTLDEMQAFTALLVSSLPIGVIATTRRGKITNWNQTVTDITEIQKGKAMGKFPEDILPLPLSVFFRSKSQPSTREELGEKEIRLVSGERESVLLCRLVDIYDKKRSYMGKMLLLTDISEVKMLEEKMRESERLAAIGKMAGGVAHEVRNPLSSIKGLSLVLQNSFLPESREYETAGLLVQETERMNRAITEMLSFTTPISLKTELVDLGALLEKELKLLEHELDENNIETTLDVADDLLPIPGDLDRLTQVIMNILLNSVQAMNETGGKLAVSAANSRDRQKIVVKITDTGRGMDKDVLAQVFYPYFTTKKKGTGLGLAISQKIVSEHKGTLSVESEKGQGTTVHLLLPAGRDEGGLRGEASETRVITPCE